MASSERDRGVSITPPEPSTEGGPAHRDAARVAERAAQDDAAAAEARARLAAEPLPTIEPDETVGPMLAQGEMVHTLRASAILFGPGDDRGLGFGGTLYLTSARLIHCGHVTLTVKLTDIAETSLAGERLLVTLRSGDGFSLDTGRPRLLRTEIAAAIRETRR